MIEKHTKEELNAVAVCAQSGDTAAMEDLFRMMRPYMVAILRPIDSGKYTLDERLELTQAASLGILEALTRFDPQAGTKFSTWAHPWMKGEVSEWLARNTGSIPMPRSAWNFAARLEAMLPADVSPHEVDDEDLATVEIDAMVAGIPTVFQVPYAGAIFRARKDSFPIDPEQDGSSSPSVEDEIFHEYEERVTLAFIDSLAEANTVDWFWMTMDFIEEHDLADSTSVDAICNAASLYLGRTP